VAIFEDLKGAKADRNEVTRNGQQALNLIRDASDGDRRLEPIVETALQDAMRRH
jgi:hypothetical protein